MTRTLTNASARDKKVTEIDYQLKYAIFSTACSVHDQSANICIQGYLRILWIRNTKSSKKSEFINVIFHVKNWSISLKVVKVKLNPWMGIMFNKWPWDGTLKTYRLCSLWLVQYHCHMIQMDTLKNDTALPLVGVLVTWYIRNNEIINYIY